MSQQFQSSWRDGRGERLWLSTLVETMEQVAQRDVPCDSQALKALRAQLALPAQMRFPTPFSLRN